MDGALVDIMKNQESCVWGPVFESTLGEMMFAARLPAGYLNGGMKSG